MPHRLRRTLLLAPLLAACHPSSPAAASTHDMSTMTMPAIKPDSARHGYTAADVRFVQGMIMHHAQALVMTALVSSHASSDAVKLLAQRIDASQKTEIATMQRWLRERGEMEHDMSSMSSMSGMSGMAPMPGMLTERQLADLAAAYGPDFDRLFLRDMIQHHEGAITMVATLFGTTGAGQEPQLFDFATGVDSDQRAEIDRMRALLSTMPATP